MSADPKSQHPLFRKLDTRLKRLASEPVPRNIHGFRTATRRLEAVLEELTPDPDRNHAKLLKKLARLRRRAGRVRDLDVQILALRNLKLSSDAGKTRILHALSELRVRREKNLLQALDKATISEIRKRLKRASRSFTVPNAIDASALAFRMYQRLARHSGPLTEALLHQYRIEGKRIRYVAEIAAGDSRAQELVTELKRMQDVLGDWHDWLTLSEVVQRLAGDNASSVMIAALTNITRAKFRDSVQVVTETRSALTSRQTEAKHPPSAAPQTAAPARPQPSAARKPQSPAQSLTVTAA